MSRRSLADSALLSRVLGTEVRAGVTVSDPCLVPAQRRELVARCALCAVGFVLASLWGTLLPLAISVLAGWDHFARRRRSVLAATATGLHLISVRGQRAELVRNWEVDVEARLILHTDKPEVPLELPEWTGVIHGADIERAERTIRAGGGEPVRLIRSD
ncbi:MAG: hypothetical protein P8J75_05140 [Actinomycetota bacterium]|jgi:hypothetical protein|nr:hypothetical protein [Actinomycetota bacterium]